MLRCLRPITAYLQKVSGDDGGCKLSRGLSTD